MLLFAGSEAGGNPQIGFHTTALHFTLDSNYLVDCQIGSRYPSGRLAALDMSQKKWVVFETTGHCFACFSDSQTVVVGGPGSALEFCDLRTGKVTRSVETTGKRFAALSLSADGKFLICAEEAGLLLREATSGKEIRRFPSGSVSACAISPDGKLALSATTFTFPSSGGNVVLWDTSTGKAIRVLGNFEGEPTYQVSFSPHSNHSLRAPGGPVIVDNQTGKIVQNLKPPGEFACMSACFTATGRYVLTGSMGEPPSLMEVASGKIALVLKHKLPQQNGELISGKQFAVSPDGTLAASAGNEHTPLVLWDLRTGRPVWSSDGLIRGH